VSPSAFEGSFTAAPAIASLEPGAVADPMVPRLFTVQRVIRETYDTVTLQLSESNGSGGFGFAPGQFNMIYVFGVGEVAISISGDPTRPELLAHTIRAVGSVTEPLAGQKRGVSLGIRGPYGSAWPLEQAARRGCDLLLLAGGIGLAPLRPVIYQVLEHRERFGRLTLLYGARTPSDLLYRKELERWRKRPQVTVRTIVDRADRAWLGPVGVLTDLMRSAEIDPANTIAMMCGPEAMMRFAQRELRERGIAGQDIFLSMERNMKCATGVCGHCQFGPTFICKDGPVFPYDRMAPLLGVREL
jgi:NAD(P)H-flavin reductase